MAELKTKPTSDDVEAFLAAIPDDRRRVDARAVCDLMADVTGESPEMWGDSIVGFGRQHLHYASGRELDWMVVGFSPRKANTTIYLSDGPGAYSAQLAQLGKHTVGRGCLYIKALADVDQVVLEDILTRSVRQVRASKN